MILIIQVLSHFLLYFSHSIMWDGQLGSRELSPSNISYLGVDVVTTNMFGFSVTSYYLASPLSVWWQHHATLLYCDSLCVSDDWGVGWERATAGLLPRREGGSQTHPADHTGHPAAGARTECHQAHSGQGLLSPDWHGGACSAVRPLMKNVSRSFRVMKVTGESCACAVQVVFELY